MKISIYTATHNTQFLQEAYDSIKDQPFDEWVILYNHRAKPIRFDDKRVREVVDTTDSGVGYYKRTACDFCTGDVLVELDHDDLLMPMAISMIRGIMTQHKDVGFLYSNTIRTDMEWNNLQHFNPDHGWKYRDVKYKDHDLEEVICFNPTPASVSRIWYAPDHVKAFRKEAYEKAGGYNAEHFILDDLDLMCRMYIETEFYHLNMPLYVYRVHGQNTWLEHNKAIQDGVYPIYHKYIENMALTWARRSELTAIDLGGRFNKDERYVSVDLKDADIKADLNKKWPMADNSVGVVRANDIFEHLKNPIHTMKELHRVLVPGGYAFIQVPSTDGRGAFQDPTHVSFWNQNSFLYYTDARWARYIDTPVRFQAMFLGTTDKNQEGVCWASAHLVKLADKVKVPGIISI